MKVYIFVPLVLVGLLQNVGSLRAQTKRPRLLPARRKRSSPLRSLRSASRAEIQPAPPVDPTLGDNVDGDDLAIRRAAVAALGTMNGSVVVVDPTNGRILTMVNQKLALQERLHSVFHHQAGDLARGADRARREPRHHRSTPAATSAYNLTTAIAHSNNQYFSILGNRLGFDRVTQYAQMLGLGEKAGLDIPGEQPGTCRRSRRSGAASA